MNPPTRPTPVVPSKADSFRSVSFRLTVQAPDRLRKESPGRVGPNEQIGRIQRYGAIARLDAGMGAQGPRTLLLLPNALFTLDPGRKAATRRAMDATQRKALFHRGSAFGLVFELIPSELWPGAKVVGQEKVQGVVCDIWELKEKGPLGGVYRAWLRRGKKRDFPLRLKVDTAVPSVGGDVNRAERMVRTVEALSVGQIGAGVDAARFAVPKGFAVREERAAGLTLSPNASVVKPQ